MKIGAVIQARTSSTRLPGKVLKKLPCGSGVTVLEQVVRRIKKSKELDSIIIATTDERSDDKIVVIAKKERVGCFRGSRDDVLSRYYLTAKKYNLDIIVRITSDCPCIDSGIIDSIIERHKKSMADYTSNTIERTYPRGLDVEVFNFSALEEAYKKAYKNYQREHVAPYIYTNRRLFKIVQVKAPAPLYGPDIRITLDTEEDYSLLCIIFDYLYSKNRHFTAGDLIRLFNKKPWLKMINKKVQQKKL